jgi:hypothetical protein
MSEVVFVLSGVKTLRQAIELKKKGVLKKIVAGPNIVVFSSDHNSILASKEIDLVIVPSQWVADCYIEDNPSIIDKISIWPAGVDTNFWSPICNNPKNKIIIYDKLFDDNNLSSQYADYLKSEGFSVIYLKYGEFTHIKYRDLLRDSDLMIGFSRSESQGIAWSEAWSVNIPTFILYSGKNFYGGRLFNCSSAPYLSDKTGKFFYDFDNFKLIINQWKSGGLSFSPRHWVCENMSDLKSAEAILKIL